MLKAIAIIICTVFLGFGLIRIGVGSALIGQELGIFDIEALAGAIGEVKGFMEERQGQQIVRLNALSYLGVIVFMGVTLAAGAVGSLRQKRWGLVLIGIYMMTHASLFLNFQTINPKVAYLGIGVLLFLILSRVNRQLDQ